MRKMLILEENESLNELSIEEIHSSDIIVRRGTDLVNIIKHRNIPFKVMSIAEFNKSFLTKI